MKFCLTITCPTPAHRRIAKQMMLHYYSDMVWSIGIRYLRVWVTYQEVFKILRDLGDAYEERGLETI